MGPSMVVKAMPVPVYAGVAWYIAAADVINEQYKRVRRRTL